MKGKTSTASSSQGQNMMQKQNMTNHNMMQGQNMPQQGAMNSVSDLGSVLKLSNANLPLVIPLVRGLYDGKDIFYITTEASTADQASAFASFTNFPVTFAPALAKSPPSALAQFYIFKNGVKGSGELGFQSTVADSIPGDPGYSPLWQINFVSWKDPTNATVLGRYNLESVMDGCCSALDCKDRRFIPNLKTTFRNFAVGVTKIPFLYKQPYAKQILKTSIYVLVVSESLCILTALTVDFIFYRHSLWLSIPLALFVGAFSITALESYKKIRSESNLPLVNLKKK